MQFAPEALDDRPSAIAVANAIAPRAVPLEAQQRAHEHGSTARA